MTEKSFSMQEFVSVVSHDLRAPMRHMRQFSHILAESLTAPTEEQEQCVAFIKSSAEQCNNMMDALSELSRLHTQPLETIATDFAALLREACAQLAVDYNCQPLITITTSGEQQPNMDLQHAKTLIAVLVENAFKFRNRDQDLTLELDITNANGQQLIKLVDNGIGIAPHFIDHCTAIFKQFDKSVAGVGMGLTLADNIVHRYHGSLTIESGTDYPQGGTTVTIVLPLKT